MNNTSLRNDTARMLRALRKAKDQYVPRRGLEEDFVKCSNGQDNLAIQVMEISDLTKAVLMNLLADCSDDCWITISDSTDLDGYSDGQYVQVMQHVRQSDQSYYEAVLCEYREIATLKLEDKIKVKARSYGVEMQPYQIRGLINAIKAELAQEVLV